MSEKPPSFEKALAELEEVVARLEAGGLTLEEALALFERGQVLAALCSAYLDQAELKVEKLRPSPGGSYDVVPFDADEEG